MDLIDSFGRFELKHHPPMYYLTKDTESKCTTQSLREKASALLMCRNNSMFLPLLFSCVAYFPMLPVWFL